MPVRSRSLPLAEAAEELSAVLESMADGFLSVDEQGCCLYANPAAERLLGRPHEALVGRPYRELFGEAFGSGRGVDLPSALMGGTPADFEYYREASARWFEVRTAPGRKGRHGIYLRDVTERKRQEQELRRTQAELLDFLENGAVALHWVGPDGTILWANQAELDLLGYTREEYFGRHIAEFHADPEVIDDILERLRRGEQLSDREARLRCKDGSVRHVAIDSNVLWFEGKFIHTRCFTRDISERKQAEEALRQQAEVLRAADRRKNEFLAMLAHELRNPLAPILTAAEVFRVRTPDDPLLQRQREVIDRQVRHMSRLLDDLLEVSRITRGKVEIKRTRLNLNTALQQALEMSRPLLEERAHALHLSLPQEALTVEGDPIRLAQVFANLLNNAARYTPPGGQVWLSAEPLGETAVITVRDTGIGMTEEVLSHAFELFAQGERSLARTPGGLGVGLTLVRELVERHRGRVTARSEGPGQGSEFTVILPLLTSSVSSSPSTV
jgi:PAS domain S-box-containing protein